MVSCYSAAIMSVIAQYARACFRKNLSLHILSAKFLNDLFRKKINISTQNFWWPCFSHLHLNFSNLVPLGLFTPLDRQSQSSLQKQPFIISAHFDSSLRILCITAHYNKPWNTPWFSGKNVNKFKRRMDSRHQGSNPAAWHCIVLYSIVLNHFYSASHSMSLSEAVPTTAIDIVSEFTRRHATGNCKWRTFPRSLRGG